MSYKLLWFVLVLSLASSPIVHADDDDLRNLFEAQFYNLTQDIKIGAKSLKINPEDIETIGVSCGLSWFYKYLLPRNNRPPVCEYHFIFSLQTEGQSKWYSEYHSFDEDEVQSDWHKLKNGYELVVSDPNNKNKGTFDHVAKVKYDGFIWYSLIF